MRFQPNQTAEECVMQFESAYTEIPSAGLMMGDSLQATVLLVFANLPEQTNTWIRSSCGTPLDLAKTKSAIKRLGRSKAKENTADIVTSRGT